MSHGRIQPCHGLLGQALATCSGHLGVPPVPFFFFPGSGHFRAWRLLISSRRRNGISCSSGCLGFMLSFFSVLGKVRTVRGLQGGTSTGRLGQRDMDRTGHRDTGTGIQVQKDAAISARRETETRAWQDTGRHRDPGTGRDQDTDAENETPCGCRSQTRRDPD